MTLTTSIREYSVIESQTFYISYPYTKFGDCRFSCFGDMFAGVEIANSVTSLT